MRRFLKRTDDLDQIKREEEKLQTKVVQPPKDEGDVELF